MRHKSQLCNAIPVVSHQGLFNGLQRAMDGAVADAQPLPDPAHAPTLPVELQRLGKVQSLPWPAAVDAKPLADPAHTPSLSVKLQRLGDVQPLPWSVVVDSLARLSVALQQLPAFPMAP